MERVWKESKIIVIWQHSVLFSDVHCNAPQRQKKEEVVSLQKHIFSTSIFHLHARFHIIILNYQIFTALKEGTIRLLRKI